MPLWIPVLVAAIVAGGFFVVVRSASTSRAFRPIHPAGLLSNMWTNLRFSGVRLRQCIGDFGWLDTPVPTWVVIVWTSCVGGLTALALTLSAPCRRALPLLALLILAMPELLYAPQMNTIESQLAGKVLAPGGGRIPAGGLDFPMAIPASSIPTNPSDSGSPLLFCSGWGWCFSPPRLRPSCAHVTRYEIGLGVPAGNTHNLVAARRPLPRRGGLRRWGGLDPGTRGLHDVASDEGPVCARERVAHGSTESRRIPGKIRNPPPLPFRGAHSIGPAHAIPLPAPWLPDTLERDPLSSTSILCDPILIPSHPILRFSRCSAQSRPRGHDGQFAWRIIIRCHEGEMLTFHQEALGPGSH